MESNEISILTLGSFFNQTFLSRLVKVKLVGLTLMTKKQTFHKHFLYKNFKYILFIHFFEKQTI